MTIRVLVVSESPLSRSGMEALLAQLPDVKPVGGASSRDAAEVATQLGAQVVLFDAGLGGPRELKDLARLNAALDVIPIVALVAGGEGPAAALSAGAASVLPAELDGRTLGAALYAAVCGLTVFPRSEVNGLLSRESLEGVPASPRVAETPVESLTSREQEVLQLMARGQTNRQIGLRLRISEHTVKFHVASVLSKLDARSRAEAVARAAALGWILL